MRILVLAGDIWHSADMVNKGLAKCFSSNWEVSFASSITEEKLSDLYQYDLLVMAKSNHNSETDKTPWLTENIAKQVFAYVNQGKSLLVIHSGLAEYDNSPLMRNLAGGIFIQHPDPCSVTVIPVKDHPISQQETPFTITDEHYFLEMEDNQSAVFLTVESEHGSQPGGWTRQIGKGKVCALTPSHFTEGWANTHFQRILINAILWCTLSHSNTLRT